MQITTPEAGPTQPPGDLVATIDAAHDDLLQRRIDAACSAACAAIAPAWPLDRAIAVNPHWSRIGMPVRRVAARMAVLGDIQVFPSRATQQLAWDQGRITATDGTVLTVPAQTAYPPPPEK